MTNQHISKSSLQTQLVFFPRLSATLTLKQASVEIGRITAYIGQTCISSDRITKTLEQTLVALESKSLPRIASIYQKLFQILDSLSPKHETTTTRYYHVSDFRNTCALATANHAVENMTLWRMIDRNAASARGRVNSTMDHLVNPSMLVRVGAYTPRIFPATVTSSDAVDRITKESMVRCNCVRQSIKLEEVSERFTIEVNHIYRKLSLNTQPLTMLEKQSLLQSIISSKLASDPLYATLQAPKCTAA